VTIDAASDEALFKYETPGSVLDGNRRRPRTDPAVVRVVERRRRLSRSAEQTYRVAP